VGVIQAFVFENTTMTTDANGLPPKSFLVVVWDGVSPLASNNALAQAIWDHKPSGIQAAGSVSGDATASDGTLHTVHFARATQLRLWVTCTTTPAVTDPTDIANIKGAIKAFADAEFNLGIGVIARSFSASPLEPTATYTPAIIDVPLFEFDTHSSPTNTANLPASGLQIFTVATADILVNGL
jgi:hypothetical protein